MNPEDKKYVWWGLLGIGVAALFYFLSSKKSSGGANTVTVPYLVPQTTTGASPTADQSLSNQPNIIGSSNNSTVPNFTNPNLLVGSPTGPNNSVASGWWNSTGQPSAGQWSGPGGTGIFVNPGIPQANSPVHVNHTP